MHFKKYFRFLFTIFTFFFISCGKTPLIELQNKSREFGFHPFVLPLEDVRPGALVAGGEKNLTLVSSSAVCFDNMADGLITSYKSLDYFHESFEFDIDTSNTTSLKMLQFINIQFKLSMAKKTHIRFSDLRIRSLEVPKLLKYIDSFDESRLDCQQLILNHGLGMIGEIVEANNIEISFMDANGFKIQLSPKMVGDFLKFDFDTSVRIVEKEKIKITGPRGIGYRLYLLGLNERNKPYIYAMSSGQTKKDGTFLLEPFKLRSYTLEKVPSTPWPNNKPFLNQENRDAITLLWQMYGNSR